MASALIVGIWNTGKFHSIQIHNINLENNVEILKDEVSNIFDKQKSTIDLLYSGLILEDNEPLSRYELVNGSTVHIVDHIPPLDIPQKRTISETEIKQLASALYKFRSSKRAIGVLWNLSNLAILESIIAANPGLEHDPVVVAFIQHSHLFVQLYSASVVREITKEHPILIDVVNYVINKVEAIDSTHVVGVVAGEGVTCEEVATALSNAINSVTDSPSATASSGGVIRTNNQMIFNRIRQAIAAGCLRHIRPLQIPPTPSRSEQESMDATIRQFQPQLHKMQQVGLRNVQNNVKALQATSGDVQAAIKLVRNGAFN